MHCLQAGGGLRNLFRSRGCFPATSGGLASERKRGDRVGVEGRKALFGKRWTVLKKAAAGAGSLYLTVFIAEV